MTIGEFNIATAELLKFLRISHDYIASSGDVSAALTAIEHSANQLLELADGVDSIYQSFEGLP